MDRYYEILGLKLNASPDEVKNAYRQLAKRWHPDKFHDNPESQKQAEAKFKEIVEAYTILKDYIPGSGNTEFSAANWATGVKVKQTSPETLYQKGVALAEREEYQEAIEVFGKAIDCDATFIKAYQYRAFILDKLGYKQRAEADFRKINELKYGKTAVNDNLYQASSNRTQKTATDKTNPQKKQATKPRETVKTNPTSQPSKNPQQGYKQEQSKVSDQPPHNPSPSNQSPNTPSDANSKKASKWQSTFISNNFPVTCVTINKTGNLLASGYKNNAIYLWDLASRKHLGTFRGHDGAIRSLAFMPDDSLLISGSDDKTIRSRKLDISNLKVLGSPNHRHTGKITALVLSANGKILVSGSEDRTVKIWHLDRNADPYTLTGFATPITALTISPNDEICAIGDLSQNVRIRRLEDGKIIRSIQVGSGVTSLCLSPDGQFLATGGFNHIIKLWNVETREEIANFVGHSDLISSVYFSPDGNQLISASWDTKIKIWQVKTPLLLETLSGHTDAIFSMAMSKDGRTLVTGSADKRIGIWRYIG